MPIDKPLQNPADMTEALRALYADLDKLRNMMDEGSVKREAAGLCKRVTVMIEGMKHLEEAMMKHLEQEKAFARHDRDVQRDGL